MAYDDELAGRIRVLLGEAAGVTEKKMFGGLVFLVHGNMAVGVHEDEMIVRLPVDETDGAVALPGVRPFDLSGGRPMRGWILVHRDALTADAALAEWVGTGRSYAASLPPKS